MWLDRGDEFKKSRAADEWDAFKQICQRDYGFYPETDGALRAAWKHLGGLAPTTAVVTKADEGGGIGGACGWLADVGVPLDWLGTGTRVPDDLAVADGAAVAAWLTAA